MYSALFIKNITINTDIDVSINNCKLSFIYMHANSPLIKLLSAFSILYFSVLIRGRLRTAQLQK